MSDRFDHLFIAPSNFDASLAFYTNVLGLEVRARWGDAETGRGVELARGTFRIVLAEPHGETSDHSGSEGYLGTQPTMHVEVEDLESRYKAVREKNSIAVVPETTHWGTRWFVVKDPDNNQIALYVPTP